MPNWVNAYYSITKDIKVNYSINCCEIRFYLSTNQKQIKMKKFNQVITVEVSVDSIADLLLSSFKEDFKYKEATVEAIIGSALNSKKIGYIFNSLNGYSNDINYIVGETVNCSKQVSVRKEVGVERSYQAIGECKIISIDLYAENKLEVEYNSYTQNGELVKDSLFVNHETCK